MLNKRIEQNKRIVLATLLISSMVMCLFTPHCLARNWRMALPGYHFDFPRDYASHSDYKTEWWYYTGHLTADDGSNFGYELTFFRSGMDVPNGVKNSPWAVDDAYMAHFAVSDVGSGKFFHTQKLNRAGINFAGASEQKLNVWNENWHVEGAGDKQLLKATSPDYSIELACTPEKPVVLHGENGVSQKASCVGCASHYFSFTRMATDGYITVRGRRLHAKGITWMDHEFGSNQLTADQVGWDWFSVQLDDRTELMLYVMRRRDKTIDTHSSGTLVKSDGSAVYLPISDYKIASTSTWKSPHSNAEYPMGWRVTVPEFDLDLNIQPQMQDQELFKKSDSADVTYWEGTCLVSGTSKGKPVKGQSYVEMTGYAEAFSKNI